MIPSRQLDSTRGPAVITIGSIHGGVRGNIIPNEVKMSGTIRTFDMGVRSELHERLERTVTQIAEAAGASAQISIDPYAPVTFNDPGLTQRTLPVPKAATPAAVIETPLVTGAEDFSYFQEKIPGVYFFLGVNKDGVKFGEAASNHSNYFFVNEDTLKTGVRALSLVALNFLSDSDSP